MVQWQAQGRDRWMMAAAGLQGGKARQLSSRAWQGRSKQQAGCGIVVTWRQGGSHQGQGNELALREVQPVGRFRTPLLNVGTLASWLAPEQYPHFTPAISGAVLVSPTPALASPAGLHESAALSPALVAPGEAPHYRTTVAGEVQPTVSERLAS